MDLHIYRNAQDRWHDLRAASLERGAVLAVNAITLTELIEKLTPDLRVATLGQQVVFARRAAPGVSVRHALEAITEHQSCRNSPPKLGGVDCEGVSARAVGVVPSRWGTTPTARAETPSQSAPPDSGGEFSFLDAYRRSLSESRLVDAPQRYWIAASRVAEKPIPWLSRFERVILHALYDLTDAEFELIRNVIQVLPDGGTVILFNTTANVKPTQFAEWTWQRFIKDESVAERTFPEFCRPHSPNSPLIERLFVFDVPRESLQPLSSLRIVQASGRYREIETIGSEIAALLERGESAHEIAVVVRHIETYGEMIEDIFSRYAIPHVFETGVPLLRVPFIKYWFALLDLATSDRSRSALARVMASAYFEPRLSPGVDVERELASFGYIDRQHLPASDLARRKNSPITTEIQRLESLLDKLESGTHSIPEFLELLQPSRALTARDRQAWRVLSEELRSIAEVFRRDPGFSEFRGIAMEVAALRTIDRLSGHAAAPGVARVRVMSPWSLGYREYRWLFAPGMADGEFPGPSSRNPLLTEDRYRSRREPLYLFMMLDSARDRVTMTYPGATLEGEPLIPSIYIGEISRHFASSPVERIDRELPVREQGECLRKVANEWRRGSIDDPSAGELLGANLVRRSLLERRGAGRGDVGPAVVRTDSAWHPSELNSLASCPFVFLARHRLGLRTTPMPDFEVPPTEVGKLAHDVLREFYAQPIPPLEAEAMDRMEQIIRRRLADADVSGQGMSVVFDPALWKIRRAQLVAALRQYVRFAVKDAFDGYETLTQYLGDPLPRTQLGPVTLGGRPDHVAVRRIGERVESIRVDDFKYSAASSATNRLLKDSFQIPIYAWLLARTINADSSTQIDGRYLLLRSPSTPVVSHAIDSVVFEELQARVVGLVDRAKEGRLHPDPADPQGCATCDYSRLCRTYGG